MIIYNKILELLQNETAEFISLKLNPTQLKFNAPMAPNSPDLNPVDYKIWGIMQQCAYEIQIHNVDVELKGRLVDVWSGLQQKLLTLLSASEESVCRRVRAKGGHFQHLL